MFLSFLQQLCVTMAGHGVSKWLKKVYIFLTKTVAILENSGADVPEYQESLLRGKKKKKIQSAVTFLIITIT